jgi:PAS domain S-box-containing protein
MAAPDIKADATTALLASIVESSDDAIVSKTLQGIIQSWNGTAERMFGYSAHEAIGQNITLIIPKERRAEETEILARLVRGEKLDHFETVRQTKDGRLLDVSLTASPIRDASGKIIGVSKIARDITERKQLEREREQLLEWERISRRRLAEAVAARDEFIAVAAHELRNPLNVSHLTIQLLHRIASEPGSSPRLPELVEKSRLQLNRLTALVDRLLDVTRINAGSFELYRETFDLSALIRELVARFAAEPFTIPITVELDTAITGSWDRLRIDQAVSNLVSNATKYGQGKPISIAAFAAGGLAVIKVRDEGPGIPADELPRIFDRFERAGRRFSGQGLGLGLWITKRIVEAHNGSIIVESREGQGSTFTITLPR